MTDHKSERVFGKATSLAFVVGTVVGTGIYLKPGQVAALTSGFWQDLMVWLLAGVFVTCGALAYSRLAMAWPQSGGAYVYLSRHYGPWAASLLLAADLLIGRPAAVGALAYGLGLIWQLSSAGCLLTAVMAVTSLTLVQLLGARVQGAGQAMMTAVQLAPLLLVLVLWPFHQAHSELSSDVPTGGVRWGAAFLAVLWAYDGWYNLTNLAGEIAEPERNIPRALVAGMMGVTALYVGLNAVLIKALGPSTLAQESLPVLTLFERWHLQPLAAGLQFFLSVSLLTTLNGTLACGSRVMVAASADGVIRRNLGAEPTALAPTLAFSGWCLGFLLCAGGMPSQSNLFDLLTELTGAVVLALSSLTTTCVFQLQRFDRPAPLGAKMAAGAFLSGNLALLLVLLAEFNRTAIFGVLAVGALGTAVWAVRRAPRSQT